MMFVFKFRSRRNETCLKANNNEIHGSRMLIFMLTYNEIFELKVLLLEGAPTNI